MARLRRRRALNPYQANADTGLIKIMIFVGALILIFITGIMDCRFEFVRIGFC